MTSPRRKSQRAYLVYPCCQRPAGSAGPVSQIAAETGPAGAKSTTVALGRQDGLQQDGLQAVGKQSCDREIGGGAWVDAARLEDGVPRQEFAEEIGRVLRRPQQSIKFHCCLA